jgi:hypothetical protein
MPGQTAFSLYDPTGTFVVADIEAGVPAYDPMVGAPTVNTGNSFGIDSEGNAWYYPEGAPNDEVARVIVMSGIGLFIEKAV